MKKKFMIKFDLVWLQKHILGRLGLVWMMGISEESTEYWTDGFPVFVCIVRKKDYISNTNTVIK